MFHFVQRAVVALYLVLVVLIGMGSDEASAHAAFDRSDPMPNSILAESPQEIRIWFTEPLEFDFSEATLYDQDGQPVAGAESVPGEGDFSLLISLDSVLERGTYSVVWNHLSAADGHTAEGYFAFTVGSVADVTAVTAPVDDDTGPSLWLRAASRWVVLLAIAPLIAGWLIWLAVLAPVSRGNDELTDTLLRRIKRILAIAFCAALIANVFALLVQGATLSGGSLASRVWDTLSDTRYGELWLLRIVLLVVLALTLLTAGWRQPNARRLRTGAALIASLVVALPISLNAHASAVTEGRTTAIVFDWTHITSAGVWFGGLVLLFGVFLRSPAPAVGGGRKEVLARTLPRFSAVAIVCWGLLTLTGVYSAWLQVGGWDALRTTDYGKSLLAKLILLAIVLVLAAFNLLFITRKIGQSSAGQSSGSGWTRRLSWTVGSEIALTVAVLFFVGRMTSLQPARDVIAAESTGIQVSLDLEGIPATLQIAPGSVGPNHFVLTVAGDQLPDDTETVIQVELVNGALGIQEIQLDRPAGNLFEWRGIELSVAGAWNLDVIVRKIGDFTWEGNAAITMEASAPASNEEPWRLTTHSIAALLLVGIGLGGLVIGWRAGPSRLRTESSALGLLAIVLGFGIMATDRVTPAGAGIDSAVVNPVAATSDSVVQGKTTYESLCLVCHGVSGEGDGPGSGGLIPAPADFTAGHAMVHPDAEWFGWIANGKPNTAMPAFGEQLSDEEIWNVINYIQTEFQGRPVIEAGAATPVASPSPGTHGTEDMEGMDHGD